KKLKRLAKRWERKLAFDRGRPRLFGDGAGTTTVVHTLSHQGATASIERWDAHGKRIADISAAASFFTGAEADREIWVVGRLEAPARIGGADLVPGEKGGGEFLGRLDASGTWRSAALLSEQGWRLVGAHGDRAFFFDERYSNATNVLTGL